MILFGSRARGNADARSDVDLIGQNWCQPPNLGKMPAPLFLVAGTFFSAAGLLHDMAVLAQHIGEWVLLAG